MYKELRTAAALAVLSLAPLAASASIINFDFSTIGTGTLGASCGANCNHLSLSGTTSVSGLDGYFGGSAPTFTFTGNLPFAQVGLGGGFGVGSGLWELTDGIGDSLSGYLTLGLSGAPSDPLRLGSFFYGVTSGTGLFGGAGNSGVGPDSNLGGSLAAFAPYPGQYFEAGGFTIEAPEPGVISLFLAGLVAMGWTLRRQARRVSVPAA